MTREQFITLVKSEQEALRGFLLALCCGKRDDADDIAQETLVKAYLSSAGYRDEGKFRAWLLKIARNTFLNHKASMRTLDDISAARSVASAATTDSAFRHQELYMALATLSAKERSAVVMFYMSGYSVKEIADITDCTVDAVKKQLSRGRDNLKTILNV